MKYRAIIILSLMALVALCRGQSTNLPVARYQNLWTVPYTNLASFTVTSNTTITNVFDTSQSLYHTFVTSFNGVGTNDWTNTWERTIDGTTWIPVQTNTLITNVNIGVSNIEQTAVGKWLKWRNRYTIQGTNSTLSTTYMGQIGP